MASSDSWVMSPALRSMWRVVERPIVMRRLTSLEECAISTKVFVASEVSLRIFWSLSVTIEKKNGCILKVVWWEEERTPETKFSISCLDLFVSASLQEKLIFESLGEMKMEEPAMVLRTLERFAL